MSVRARHRSGGPAAVVRGVRSAIRQQIEATNAAWESGNILADSPLRDVADSFHAVQYAPWYEGGWWSGDRAAWVAGTEAAAAAAGPGHRWEALAVRVVPRSDDEAMASYVVRLSLPDPARPPASAFFLETWRHDGSRWLLVRHTAEKA